jgi:hypothetical protein
MCIHVCVGVYMYICCVVFDFCLDVQSYILCDCEAVAQIRFRHLGQFFVEPSEYYDAPIDKVLHFIQGVGLIKG